MKSQAISHIKISTTICLKTLFTSSENGTNGITKRRIPIIKITKAGPREYLTIRSSVLLFVFKVIFLSKKYKIVCKTIAAIIEITKTPIPYNKFLLIISKVFLS